MIAQNLHHKGGHSVVNVLLVIALIAVAAAVGMNIYQARHASPAPSVSTAPVTAATPAMVSPYVASSDNATAAAPPLTSAAKIAAASAATEKAKKSMSPAELKAAEAALNACRRRHGTRVGVCQIDPTTKRAYLQCTDNLYGPSCSLRCASTATRPRTYTPGGETSSPSPATCDCPDRNRFLSKRECEAGAPCETGWHGSVCDQGGVRLDCGPNGKQQANLCVCNAGFTGEKCQYPTDLCTSKDKSATLNADGSCSCGVGFVGSRCTQCGSGYYEATSSSGATECVLGTVCELKVNATSSGQSASGLQNDAGSTKLYQLSSYGIGKGQAKNAELKRTSGTDACVARFESDSCAFEFVLPSDHTEGTSFDFNTHMGDEPTSVRLGSRTQMNKVIASSTDTKQFCDDPFATGTDCNATGNVCTWSWT